MDPPSSFPLSPAMPLFPVSPERVAGTKPPYNGPTSPSRSVSDLRTSPIRQISHRRTDSDVSVHGLAAMFENLDVQDFKEAQTRYLNSLEKQKAKHTAIVKEMERKHAQALGRHEVRIDELTSELKRAKDALKDSITRSQWDDFRQECRDREEHILKDRAEQRTKRKQVEAELYDVQHRLKKVEAAAQNYREKWKHDNIILLKTSAQIADLNVKVKAAEQNHERAESKAEQQGRMAEKYKHELYSLEVKLVGTEASLQEQLRKMEEKVKLVEEERDALRTNLKEEEVLRIAAEGRIPLPAPAADDEEFGSPIRSVRKQATINRDDDKENVAPKKATVELKMLQKELEAEKRLRQRAEEQIDFMKMECQFQCCSCRLADLKGSIYVHDNGYMSEMERIKMTIPEVTPPASCNGDRLEDMVEDVVKGGPANDELTKEGSIKAESEDVRMVDIPEMNPAVSRPLTPTTNAAHEIRGTEDAEEILFSPTTGTFRAVPSPIKAEPQPSSPPPPCESGLSSIKENLGSSPWAPTLESTVIRATMSPPPYRSTSRQPVLKSPENSVLIHEDAVVDSEDEDELSGEGAPATPRQSPPGPALTPLYMTRTITTTTTIPLHFSPMTPHVKNADKPLTPSTISHMPAHSSAQPLAELSLNNVPFDREAALEQIRLRRGRARSMAAGQGTPRKQMMEGVGPAARRDISAPVSKFRR